jgi:hypothetical protein
MSNPVTPVVTSTVAQAQAQLDADQLATLLGAIQSANVLALPGGATLANLQSLNLSILPTGAAKLNVAIRS